jgi:3-oxoacyl-[acyl-carrier-protein] synthase-3
MNHPAAIRSLACALPRRLVANHEGEFAALWRELPASWWQFWGIERRPMMDRTRETAETMALAACEQALRDAEVRACDLDLVLTSSSCPTVRDGTRYRMCPRLSGRLCTRLGARTAVNWDVEMGCLTFMLLLQQAVDFVRAGVYARVLICSVETVSEILDFGSKESTTFGDGAAAAVIERRDDGGDMIASAWASSGAHYSVATLRRRPPVAGGVRAIYFTLAPDGRTRMMGFVPQTIPTVVQGALLKAGMTVDDVSQFIFHQPGRVLIDAWAYSVGEVCGDIGDRYPVILADHGCLVSVAVPATLHLAVQRGLIEKGQHVMLAGLGVGWGYGAQLWRWGETRVSAIVPSDAADRSRTD